MNKIYALKYNRNCDQLIPVAEFCQRKTKSSTVKRLATALLVISGIIPSLGYAGIATSVIPYQTYRDFSENKGLFTAGATNIPIYDKNNSLRGTLNLAPMPDFASVDKRSATTNLIDPQYSVGAAHNFNGIGASFSFGHLANEYQIVKVENLCDEKNSTGSCITRDTSGRNDFALGRYSKLVTEATPIPVTEEGRKNTTYQDKTRYPVYYHVGSGGQYIRDPGLNEPLKPITNSGEYTTGGTIASPSENFNERIIAFNASKNKLVTDNGALPLFNENGDSGSPVFAYDTQQNKWVQVGVLTLLRNHAYDEYNVIPLDFINPIMSGNTDPVISYDATKEALQWTFNQRQGTGSLQQTGGTVFVMHGKLADDLNAGKNLLFNGERGKINLLQSVDQGAGSLTFNTDYAVTSGNKSVWQGAGLIISQGVTVNWGVNGVKDDNLHKIGTGTLIINGTGINPGGLKVGDGTVILSQKSDFTGVQAFSALNINSGRATVQLSDAQQINPDNIVWGYRGGILDINGNDLEFHQLNAADNGAMILNTNTKTATVTFNPTFPVKDPFAIYDYGVDKEQENTKDRLYKYNNTKTNKTNYFIRVVTGLPVLHNGSYNLPGSSWEYLGDDEEAALKQYKATYPEKANTDEGEIAVFYHGNIKGKINSQLSVDKTNHSLVFDGNINTPEGEITHRGGKLVLQGHPVIHAYNKQSTVERLNALGDHSLRTTPTTFDQPDWENRTFQIKTLNLQDTTLQLARNATLKTNIEARDAKIILGSPTLWLDKKDGDGIETDGWQGTSVASAEEEMSVYQGHIHLQSSPLEIREFFAGSVTAADSKVDIYSNNALFNGDSTFTNTDVILKDSSRLTANAGWSSNRAITVSENATLILSATPQNNNANSVSPAVYSTPQFTLQGNNSTLTFSPYTQVTGDIIADGTATISVIADDKIKLAAMDNPHLFNEFINLYSGKIQAATGSVSLQNSQWRVSGDSNIDTLNIVKSQIDFSSFNSSAFHHLRLNTLQANNAVFLLKSSLLNNDSIEIVKSAQGSDNSLLVNLLQPADREAVSHQTLLSAPAGTAKDLFASFTATAESLARLHQLKPIFDIVEKDGKVNWVFKGYETSNSSPEASVTDPKIEEIVIPSAPENSATTNTANTDSPNTNTPNTDTENTNSATASLPAPVIQPQGNITSDGQPLMIAGTFNGAINASNSTVSVTSDNALLTSHSEFHNSEINLNNHAQLKAQAGWSSDTAVNINDHATLMLAATPQNTDPSLVTPTSYTASVFNLAGNNNQLNFTDYTEVTGDIHANGNATITIGGADKVKHIIDLNAPQNNNPLFNQFTNLYTGKVTAPQASVSMKKTLWNISDDSVIQRLNSEDSIAHFNENNATPTQLKVDQMIVNHSTLLLNSSLSGSDSIEISQQAQGGNNTLVVNVSQPGYTNKPLNITLVKAPAGTPANLLTFEPATERTVGFNKVTPILTVESTADSTQWIFSGYQIRPDEVAETGTQNFNGLSYKNFMTEANNLNKRMGDLRNSKGEAGAWARIMNGAGTGQAGYSDRYTHLQIGADKKQRLYQADWFTGVLMSYTSSQAGSAEFSGKTHSFGGGLYSSILFDSGFYIDVIGKYIQHNHDYSFHFAGLGQRNYHSHSWYAGAETGYRYPLTPTLYIEPQLELIYGAVSGSQFHWQDSGLDLAIQNKNFTPLIGRTGISAGKTFSGKGWQVTAHAGIDYQFDLLPGGETVIRDNVMEQGFRGEKDRRMLYHFGVNARVNDKLRVGLEFEQSVFGKYNENHVINANVRYAF